MNKQTVSEADLMTCFVCGKGRMHRTITDLTGERNGESFTVRTEGVVCSDCGHKTFDSDQSSKFTQLVSDAYRTKHNMVTGVEMRAFRERYQMSQQAFADYLGAGIASVKRWELGKIQDKATDRQIRAKMLLKGQPVFNRPLGSEILSPGFRINPAVTLTATVERAFIVACSTREAARVGQSYETGLLESKRLNNHLWDRADTDALSRRIAGIHRENGHDRRD